MGFKNRIGQFLLVMMLAMQLALAHHATVHFVESVYQTSHSEQHDHGKTPDKDKLCQVCLLSKDFTKILTPSDVVIAALVLSGTQIIVIPQAIALNASPLPYTARAPPVFSA